MTRDARSLYHTESAPGQYWSTANVGEAMPGVVTPFGWSVWGPAIDVGMKDAFRRTGALEPERVVFTGEADSSAVTVFHGRGALSVNFLCEMGDRLPGTSADAIAKQLLGEVPAGISIPHTRKRLPAVAVKMPKAFAGIRKEALRDTAHTQAWWQEHIRAMDSRDLEATKRALDDARKKQIEMTKVQARAVFVGVQSIYDQLLALIAKSGISEEQANALMAGQGSHAETEIIADLWDLGRDKMTLEAFLDKHGYHGLGEGQLISKMWREDPEPVLRLAKQYSARPDSEHPHLMAEKRTREREAAEKALLAKLPAWKRPMAKQILKLAVARIPLRGVAKEALIRCLDVCRAAARRMGTLLVEQGVLNEVDDVFYFTADELLAGLPANAKELAAERRAIREDLLRTDIPRTWDGTPTRIPISEPAAEATGPAPAAPTGVAVTGIGASGGVVEGTARVVFDPTEVDVEPGDIIVAPTTDPSWAAVLFLAEALVVDIGGPLSHAAVVARECGIPCVIGTDNGTAVLRSGDRIRVDGNKGTVEILSRAPATV
ncbi:PEP-utilizing enzyme [Sporichthya brevicatena]